MKNGSNEKGKNIVFIAATVLVIAVLVMAFYEYVKKSEKNIDLGENSQANRAIKTEDGEEYKLGEDEYSVKVEEKDGSKIVTNEEAGVSIKLPDAWNPGLVYDKNNELKLKVTQNKDTQPAEATELSDGNIIEIYSHNNGDDLSLKGWLEKEKINNCESIVFNDEEACKIEKDFSEYDQDDFSVPPYGNWSNIYYFVKKENQIYELSCYSIGEKYKEYAKECEKILQDNLFLR